MYERIGMFLFKAFSREKEQSYHYLFVSMPLNFEDDSNIEDEGMIGKVLNDARKNQKDTNERLDVTDKKNEDNL